MKKEIEDIVRDILAPGNAIEAGAIAQAVERYIEKNYVRKSIQEQALEAYAGAKRKESPHCTCDKPSPYMREEFRCEVCEKSMKHDVRISPLGTPFMSKPHPEKSKKIEKLEKIPGFWGCGLNDFKLRDKINELVEAVNVLQKMR